MRESKAEEARAPLTLPQLWRSRKRSLSCHGSFNLFWIILAAAQSPFLVTHYLWFPVKLLLPLYKHRLLLFFSFASLRGAHFLGFLCDKDPSSTVDKRRLRVFSAEIQSCVKRDSPSTAFSRYSPRAVFFFYVGGPQISRIRLTKLRTFCVTFYCCGYLSVKTTEN